MNINIYDRKSFDIISSAVCFRNNMNLPELVKQKKSANMYNFMLIVSVQNNLYEKELDEMFIWILNEYWFDGMEKKMIASYGIICTYRREEQKPML